MAQVVIAPAGPAGGGRASRPGFVVGPGSGTAL